MTPKEYVEQAVRTKGDAYYPPFQHTPPHVSCISVDVLHAIVGISTEAGELLDVAKKSMFYGKPVDYVNLDEEIGDVLWYVAVYCHARGLSMEQIMQRNIAKLRVRFPDHFTEDRANNRDLATERAALEVAHNANTVNYGHAEVLMDEQDDPPRDDTYRGMVQWDDAATEMLK